MRICQTLLFVFSTATFMGACVDPTQDRADVDVSSVEEGLVAAQAERCPDIHVDIPVLPQSCITPKGVLGVKDCYTTSTIHQRLDLVQGQPTCVTTSTDVGPVICGPCHPVYVP